MSKRAGNVILMSDIVDEIGADALRFIFASKKSDTALEFDLAEFKKQDSSNPIFYIQYAHARINTIFSKSTISKEEILSSSLQGLDDNADDYDYADDAVDENDDDYECDDEMIQFFSLQFFTLQFFSLQFFTLHLLKKSIHFLRTSIHFLNKCRSHNFNLHFFKKSIHFMKKSIHFLK